MSESPSNVLVVMRGCPGSGKSTLAQAIAANHPRSVVLSTDDYFVDPHTHEYDFDPSLLGQAHQWNQSRALDALQRQVPLVIIDNTHTQKWEARPYVQLALQFNYAVEIKEPQTEWWLRRDVDQMARKNSHGVSVEAIARMLERWESDFEIDAILKSRRPAPAPRPAQPRSGPSPGYTATVSVPKRLAAFSQPRRPKLPASSAVPV
ncbi:AAA domain-containing protein [Polychytrium aggregatum]|uniref:AAA domain-containing protein n=1 Tax=Polychytrium aggregatum TaxID=110093 RepID=UPI0022FE7DA1|nr:AAA domain-containing protein [Polychytrium aggregatum]KAI9208962.1 AAA domain-containing protein [Polychytrium aggregatum]